MTKISLILTDTTDRGCGPNGLLPYLAATIDTNFERFQIRPYTWKQQSNTSGFRLGRIQSTEVKPHRRVTQTISIGRMIPITDGVQSQIAIADIANELAGAIATWSEKACPYLVRGVDDIGGGVVHEQRQGTSGGTAGSWWAIVVLEFDVVYMDG